MVDEIDRKIISILQENARLSNAEIAEVVGLTASSVHERVKKLEKKGVLRRYVAIVDADMLGHFAGRLGKEAHHAVAEDDETTGRFLPHGVIGKQVPQRITQAWGWLSLLREGVFLQHDPRFVAATLFRFERQRSIGGEEGF